VQQGAEGAGRAWYVGTVPDPVTLATILRRACEHADVRPALGDASGLDVTVRTAADADFVCAVNHGDRAVALPVDGVDLLTGQTWSSGDELAGGAVAVVRRAH
jgi:beta-galactosidase